MANSAYLTLFIFILTISTNIAIAIFVYLNNVRHATNRLFLALSIAISAWLSTMLATNVVSINPYYLYLARSTLIFATPMNVLFLLFAKTVPEPKLGMSRRWLIVLLIAAAGVIGLTASPLAFSGVSFVDGKPNPIPGPVLPLFGIFSIALNISAVAILYIKSRRATDQAKLQLQMVLLGILVMFGMIFGTIFVPVLLLGDVTFVTFAPLYVLIFTGMTAYAVFKQKLLNVRVASAEIFSAVLMLVDFMQLFLPGSYLDFALRITTFIFVGIFSVLFIRSVRTQVRHEQELQALTIDLAKANAHLEEVDAAKSEFLSIASHQLRTPVSVLKGYLSLIMEGVYGKVPDQVGVKVNEMFNMNERLVHLINNILNISRIEKNRIEYHFSEVDVGSIVDGAVKEVVIKAAEKGLGLQYTPPAEPLMAFTDPDKMHEISVNLIENAVKYSEHGTVEVAVTRDTSEPSGEFIKLTVKDQGIGMPKEDQARVFEKFYRIFVPGARHQTGSGLGLFICKKFLQNMGGRIWIADSVANKGTTMAAIVPTKESQIPPQKKDAEEPTPELIK